MKKYATFGNRPGGSLGEALASLGPILMAAFAVIVKYLPTDGQVASVLGAAGLPVDTFDPVVRDGKVIPTWSSPTWSTPAARNRRRLAMMTETDPVKMAEIINNLGGDVVPPEDCNEALYLARELRAEPFRERRLAGFHRSLVDAGVAEHLDRLGAFMLPLPPAAPPRQRRSLTATVGDIVASHNDPAAHTPTPAEEDGDSPATPRRPKRRA